MIASVEEKNALLIKFMGYEFVTIGYWGQSDETQWQRDNDEWMEKNDLNNVGDYLINKDTNHIIELEYEKIDYDKDWKWLMAIVKKLETMGYVIVIVGNTCLIQSDDVYSGAISYHKGYSDKVEGESKEEATFEALYKLLKYNEQTLIP
jgi:hypothetical protein